MAQDREPDLSSLYYLVLILRVQNIVTFGFWGHILNMLENFWH